MDIKKIKKLVVNIDMVVGFCEKGAMADVTIKRAVPYQIKKLEEAKKEEGTQIVFIEEWHDSNCQEFKYFPEHCVKGTDEVEFIDELQPYVKDSIVFHKNATMGMTEEFNNFIDKCESLEEIEIQGCCTDICVMNFAIPVKNRLNEKNRDVEVVVYEETVETYDAPNHNRQEYNEWTFKFMAQNGIKIKKIGGK